MPMDWEWGVAGLCVFLSASLAVGAGIGGGALFVAAYILILGFDAHGAVPLSKATIFGLAVAAYTVNIWKRHPMRSSRSLIDYDTALMLEPMTLLGTLAGVVLNVLFPNWLVLLPLCILLFVVSYRTIKKGLRIRKKEQETPTHDALELLERNKRNGEHGENEHDDDHRDDVEDDEENRENSRRGSAMEVDANSITRAHIASKEARLAPPERLILLVFVWIGYFIISFLLFRADDVVKPCSSGWILVFLFAIPYVVFITWISGRMLEKNTKMKKACGYEFLPGDVLWEGDRLYKYPALAFFAGVAAAMMGIGGGMVKGPIMLAMGIQPQVATTTSSFMIIFTSSTTTIQYLILGKLDATDLAIVMSLGFGGALVGQLVVNGLVAKYKKQSFLIFLLGGLTIISGIIIVSTSLAFESFSDTSLNTDELCRITSNATTMG
eukprot:m.102158 g.102158  ORF g.102158 m.102158 type:complete len:438 (+) comp9074_c0_seq3:351-1664(+)